MIFFNLVHPDSSYHCLVNLHSQLFTQLKFHSQLNLKVWSPYQIAHSFPLISKVNLSMKVFLFVSRKYAYKEVDALELFLNYEGLSNDFSSSFCWSHQSNLIPKVSSLYKIFLMQKYVIILICLKPRTRTYLLCLCLRWIENLFPTINFSFIS